jgi:glutamate/tyrosine decarboxylase-like PLP-dependent enzyme
MIEDEPALELLAPVELSAVCFRWTNGSEDTLNTWNAEILRRVDARGNAALSNATIRGRFGLRACIVNHLTTDDHVEAIVKEVLAAAETL